MPVSHNDCMTALRESQDTEFDNREAVREADLFLNKRDGQWEPQILSKWVNRPRYTFDECNPIVDEIMGELETTDFGISVAPTSTAGSKAVSNIYEGMVRNTEMLSGARFIYNDCARIMVGTGFAAWRVVSAFRDDNSFFQDLLLQAVPNAQDCVWFDPDSIRQDASDAKVAWILTSMTQKKYKELWPEGSGTSVGNNLRQQAYTYKKPYEVIIGEYLVRKEDYRELALLSDGRVFEVDEEFLKVKDELLQNGIQVNRTRKRKFHTVYQYIFDGTDFLDNPKKTVFSYIPVVPVYGNFRVSENKIIYWGAIEKLMDPQRVINYSESRKIEEGALAPKGKIWMSKDQAKSTDVRQGLATLNTNTDPVQFYDYVEGQTPPAHVGAPPSNPGLVETTQTAQNFIQRVSGTFDEARGTAPPRRSGVAIERLQAKSDSPKQKWRLAMEVALSHTFRIIVDAMPRVYDVQQQVRILHPDQKSEIVQIYQPIVDEDSGETVYLNDLRQGKYDAQCISGPAFHSRQQETVSAITDYAQVDPSILQMGGDILLNNISSPGMDKIAERKRMQMLVQGLIPPNQQTEEEKQVLAQMNANKDNDMSPLDKANLMIAQAQLQDVEGRNQERSIKLQLEQQKLDIERQSKQTKAMLDSMEMVTKQLKAQAEVLKLIREAIGADVIIAPKAIKAFHNQADDLNNLIAQ